jgi:hypothetical protein
MERDVLKRSVALWVTEACATEALSFSDGGERPSISSPS